MLLAWGCDESTQVVSVPPDPIEDDSTSDPGEADASTTTPDQPSGIGPDGSKPTDGSSEGPLSPNGDAGASSPPTHTDGPSPRVDAGSTTPPDETGPDNPGDVTSTPDAGEQGTDDGSTQEPGTDPEEEPGEEEPGETQTPWVSGLDERPSAPTLNLPDELEIAAPGWTPVVAFPGVEFDFPTFLGEAPGTGLMFVTEMNGRIYSFENNPEVTEKHLVLDISDHTQGQDCGLLGVAFHPEFADPTSPNRGYIYVQYPFKADPIVAPDWPPGDLHTRWRLARFTVDLDTMQADPATELVLIDQEDEHLAHQGSPPYFDPDDGFLYIAVGDEGSHDCFLRNCQLINKDLYSGVLRLDVDMRGGNISHPIPRQPLSGTSGNYYIPNDNPFVGQPEVLEEFYAVGLREPHRMTYDPVDKLTWIGDVGQARVEEINVLSRAANFQWASLEGALPVFDPIPAQPLGNWTNPLLALGRDEAGAIIGGYVYRGTKNPSLYGRYVFADFHTGNIWALSYSYDGTRVMPLERELLLASRFAHADGIVSFGVDRNNELYMLIAGRPAQIYTLARTDGFTNAPTRLSETGVFVDTASPALEAQPGLVPYDVQSPLWSDGAEKRRWASIPDGETVAFSARGNWSFPDGSVFVKHFELALDEAHPELKRRLETRLLVQGPNERFYGLTYKWNEEGTDADLLLERQVEPIDVALEDGDTRHLKYFYPGPGDCARCHSDQAGPVLGIRTSQLNHDMQYSDTGRVSNQLFTWGQTGLIDVALDQTAIDRLVSLTSPNDTSAPAEDRVRSYWASNCAMCHRGLNSESGMHAYWDARFEVPLDQQNVIDALSESALPEEAYLVVPGDAASSVLYQRSSSTLPGFAMPPIGRSAADPNYVQLLEEWITSLSDSDGQ